METYENKQRIIQELVPGKQITLSHIIANPDEILYKKLGLDPSVDYSQNKCAIGLVTMSPAEYAIIGADLAIKKSGATLGFVDRFSGTLIVTGTVSEVEASLNAVNEYAEKFPKLLPTVTLDCKLNPAALSVDLAEEVKALEPFGVGNPTPVFGLFDVIIDKISPVGAGGKHLRLAFSKGDVSFTAMLFGTTKGEFAYNIGDRVDLAVNIDTNFYAGNTSLTISVREMRKSGIDEDKLISQIELYESFKSGIDADYSEILPKREEVGAVYKTLIKSPASLDRLLNMHINGIGYAKTLVSAQALCELKICSFFDVEGVQVMKVVNAGEKNALENASILRKLKGEA
jgi:ethanolamine utilization protein EutS